MGHTLKKHTSIVKFRNLPNFWREVEKHQKFDREKLLIVDVNKTVIEKFNQCCDLRKLYGYKDLPNKIKEFIEKHESETVEKIRGQTRNISKCIDSLGVYISPQDEDQANILLSKEKIKAITLRNNYQDINSLYEFVTIHEVAHALMCPILAKDPYYKRTKKNATYVLIEESLATAFALKYMEESPDYSKLEVFVQTQPAQYTLGLWVLKNHEKNLEEIMDGWKICKCKFVLNNDLLIALLGGDFDESNQDLNIGSELYKCSEFSDEISENLVSQAAKDRIKDIFIF